MSGSDRRLACAATSSDWSAASPSTSTSPLWSSPRRSSTIPASASILGRRTHFETAGVFNYIVQNSPNVGTAITNAMRYLRLIIDAAELSLEFTGPQARLVYRVTDPTIVPSRHYAELVIAYGLKGMRVIVADHGWTPDEIRFRHAPPTDTSPHERLFGATIRFEQNENALVFDRGLLSRPIRTADLQLLRILEEHAQDDPGRAAGHRRSDQPA